MNQGGSSEKSEISYRLIDFTGRITLPARAFQTHLTINPRRSCLSCDATSKHPMADNPGPAININEESPPNEAPNINNDNNSSNVGNGGNTTAAGEGRGLQVPIPTSISTSTSNEIDVYYRRGNRMPPIYNSPPRRDRSRQPGNNNNQSLTKDSPLSSLRGWRFGNGDAYGAVANLGKWYEWTAYYVPILEWLPQYKCCSPLPSRLVSLAWMLIQVVRDIPRDLFAGLTLASISIPMSLSYAAYSPPPERTHRNLVHVS